MSLSTEEQRALFTFVAENITEGLFCLDTDGRILYANETAGRMLGQSLTELSARDIYHVAPEMTPTLWRELWKEIRTQASFAFEFPFAGSDNRILLMDIVTHHLESNGRELACAIFRDTEERRRLHTLQQEFVSTVSHELRTPATVIREGVSQVLEGLRGDINEAQKRALSLALSGIDRLGRIIGDLLDISRIESGKISLKKERISLTALVRDVAGTFQVMAEERGLDLRVTTPAGPVMIYGDHDRLTQVLTNLVGNSLKFTEKGHIEIAVTPKEKDVECSVADTGIGIKAGDLEKVFAKFEQLGQVAFTGEKGTGLGLSISRAIIELHRGHIWAESAGPRQGTRLVFSLARQNGKDVFLEQVAPLLHDVSRRGGTLSTVVFKLSGTGQPAMDNTLAQSVLEELKQAVRQETNRLSDLLVLDSDALYVALQGTVKREGARVAERVVTAIRESRATLKNGGSFGIGYTITSFPEEAKEENVYLDKIFRTEKDR